MKKLIFSAAAGIVLCAAGFTGYTVYENQTALKQSDLMIKNLEALTQNEGNPQWGKQVSTRRDYVGTDQYGQMIYLVIECCTSAHSQYNACSSILPDC